MKLTIKRKLIFLLLASVALVLVLVGTSFDQLVRHFHREQAGERFTKVFEEIGTEIERRESKLYRSVEDLAKREGVVAAISMIYRYAQPEHYRPLIYDVEKHNLTRELVDQAHAGGIGQLVAYDANGALVAFHREQEPMVTGFLSYRGGAPVMMTGALGAPFREGTLPETVHHPRDTAATGSPAPVYRRCPAGFVIEVTAPVLREFPGGATEVVGHLVGTQFIREDFLAEITKRTDVETAMIFPDGQRLGGLRDITSLSTDVITELDRRGSGAYQFLTHSGHFLSAVSVPLVGGEQAVLVAGIPLETVETEIERTQGAMVVILLVSALIIIPVGALTARRLITEPVDHLVASAEALGRGEFGRKVPVHTDDELGQLARTFNAMADTIEQRQHALAESEYRYRTLVENLPQRIFYKDRNFAYVSVNERFAEDLGLAADQVAGRVDEDFFPPELAAEYREGDRRVMESGHIIEFEERYIRHGLERYIHTVKTPLRDSRGEVMGILGIFWDVTERKQAEDRLRQSAAVFENTADGVMITNANQEIIAVNTAFTEITGFSAEEATGNTPSMLKSERQDAAFYRAMWKEIGQTGRWRGEIWNRRKSGEVHPVWMTISVVRDPTGRIVNYVGVFSDITAIKHSQEQLDHLAHHDPLTDLPNRLLLSARLTHAMEQARREDNRLAVLFLDLDRFKNVNDTLGHPVGDQLLQMVAARLRDHLRECDTVARIGGDEFVVTLDKIDDPSEVTVVAQKLLDVLVEPFVVADNELHLGASIGIAVFPKDGDDMATLLKNADAAMYLAKEQGRNTYRFYTTELGIEAEERFYLESGLRHALQRDEFTLYYQPQVDMETGRVTGAEALLRWQHPELGMVSPVRFIPLAEDTGLILPIGEWVLHEACRQFVAWRSAGLALERISVNLSGVQVQHGNLVATVQKALVETGIDPRHLELEITESQIMRHPEQAAVILDGLQELGVELAIDDFGTGYSSLSYLKRFPLDNLKVDKSFVHDIPHDANDAAIVRAVIALAENLQLRVTAEGVETEAQRDFLLAHGCRQAQGWLFGRPVPAQEFAATFGDAVVLTGDGPAEKDQCSA
ncbi:MAG: EAL domain-containing protein [Thiohalomonadaceae bacterium]